MFIIEGADELGKTTLAEKIYKRMEFEYPVRISHMGKPCSGFKFSYEHYQDMISVWAIQDRFHLGGLVWHREVLHRSVLTQIEERLEELASVTVILFHSGSEYKDLLYAGKKQMFSHDVILNANRKFQQMVSKNEVEYDFFWDVKSGYVPDAVIDQWVTTWKKRLQCLEK